MFFCKHEIFGHYWIQMINAYKKHYCHPSILDSKAFMTILKSKSCVPEGSHREGSFNSVKLAAGNWTIASLIQVLSQSGTYLYRAGSIWMDSMTS